MSNFKLLWCGMQVRQTALVQSASPLQSRSQSKKTGNEIDPYMHLLAQVLAWTSPRNSCVTRPAKAAALGSDLNFWRSCAVNLPIKEVCAALLHVGSIRDMVDIHVDTQELRLGQGEVVVCELLVPNEAPTDDSFVILCGSNLLQEF